MKESQNEFLFWAVDSSFDEFEESDEYKLGKILISNFETITSEKLYKYGDVEFVNKINKIKNINEITKYEKDIFPIIIFDKKDV